MRRQALRVVAFAMLALGAIGLLPSAPALAHTGLDSSTPADGATVVGPLTEIELVFTGTPTAIDDGILVADSAGNVIAPVEIVQEGLVITARFEPALAAGPYALSWRVRSDDTHVIDGTLQFTVDVPATTVPATTVPATTAPATTEAGESAAPPSSEPSPSGTESPSDSATSDSTVAATTEPAADESLVAPPAVAPPAPPSFDDGADGQVTADVGRLIVFPSAIVAIGTLAFAAWAFAGRRDELDSLLRLARWLGVGVALGALVEVIGLEALLGGYDAVLDATTGRAVIARGVGGLLVAVGLGSVAMRSAPRARSLSAAVRLDEPAESSTDSSPSDSPTDGRWRPGARDAAALVGVAVIALSFAFDGHTLSEGPRFLHAVASVAHVVAAAVWAGGLVAFAVVLWRRHRTAAPSRAVEMTLRFSVAAMVSLAVAGIAGIAMALFIESDLGSYLTTEWGRLLLVKLGFVAVAAAIGAYNHFVMLPRLEAAPNDEAIVQRTRATVTAEAGLLVIAAVVSAFLVAASTI